MATARKTADKANTSTTPSKAPDRARSARKGKTKATVPPSPEKGQEAPDLNDAGFIVEDDGSTSSTVEDVLPKTKTRPKTAKPSDRARSAPKAKAKAKASVPPSPETCQETPQINAQMLAGRHWLLHKAKKPYYANGKPRSGKLDSTADIAKLVGHDDAVAVAANGTYTGLGFAINRGYQFVDLDKCRDPATGALDARAQAVVEAATKLDAFVEVSLSGTGIHVMGCGGALPTHRGGGVEVYTHGRYMALGCKTLSVGANPLPDLAALMPLLQITPLVPFDADRYAAGQPFDFAAAEARAAEAATKPMEVVPLSTDTTGAPAAWARDMRTAMACMYKLSPDIEYDDWVKVGMALHKESGGCEQGLSLWEAWSSYGGKYKWGECRAKWSGFSPHGGIGLGTLIHLAGGMPKPSLEGLKDAFAQKGQEQAKSGAGDAQDDEDDEEFEQRAVLAALPEVPPEALHGIVGDFAVAAAEGSEASAIAVYATALTHLGVAVTAPFKVDLGYDVATLVPSTILCGLSSKGRKGSAAAPIEKGLMPALRKVADQHRALQEQEHTAYAMLMAEANKCKAEAERLTTQAAVFKNEPARESEAPELQAKLDKLNAKIKTVAEKLDDATHAGTITSYSKTLAQFTAEADTLAAKIEADKQTTADRAEFDADPQGYTKQRRDRINELLTSAAAHEKQATQNGVPALGPVYDIADAPHLLRAVSSGEGIVEVIADPRTKPDGTEVPGTRDKRLLIDLSEYGGMLATAARQGNTATEKIRDGIDGRDIATAGRADPATATDPHLGVIGHVTGSELVLRAFNDDKTSVSDDGLLNRHLIIFTTRTKLVPRPTATGDADAVATRLWANIQKAYEVLDPKDGTHGTAVPLSDEAAVVWDAQYEALSTMHGASGNAAKMLARAEWHGRKLAALLTILDGCGVTQAVHVKAAVALVAYMALSADKLLATYEQREVHKHNRAQAEKVAATMAVGEVTTAREIQRATHLDKDTVAEALRYLTSVCSPPRVRVTSTPTTAGGAPKTSVLRLY